MTLPTVDIRPRFRRAVRIDRDYSNTTAIDGFFCPTSFQQALQFMARHIADTQQSAFTWTGPYGGGKSSLALALACLTGASKTVREQAAERFGGETVAALKDALPYYPARWDVLPIVCEKRSIGQQLGDALGIDGRITTKKILSALEARSTQRGLLVILDELGRGLEAAADGDGDVHILQDLAEFASRSEGKLVLIGILHQAFEEYADKLGREARDSWAKIQGRFVDISVSVSLEENIELIGQALGDFRSPKGFRKFCDQVAAQLRSARTAAAQKRIGGHLAKTAPLHPLATCLLGPLSRRRFGQNQRSVFSFLHSSEPFGLQDIREHDVEDGLYPVFRLWDYVRANFESAVLSSPDSRRWATAADAIDRCVARSGTSLEVRLLKTIGVVELLKDRSGITSTQAVLKAALCGHSKQQIESSLRSLERNSEIVFRKHVGAYVLFAGSDFDIENSVEKILSERSTVDASVIQSLADIQPLLAKRHHSETGSMRWFDVRIDTVDRLNSFVSTRELGDTIGEIVLCVPTLGEQEAEIEAAIGAAIAAAADFPLIVGYSPASRRLVDLCNELSAMTELEKRHPELRGDPVARREISARSADLKRRIESEVQALFETCRWHDGSLKGEAMSKRRFSEHLSIIADNRFKYAPRIQNELLNCSSPSSNAVSARTKLMKRMVLNAHEPDLGFGGKNYPAERGLYVSLLKETGIHCQNGQTSVFMSPSEKDYHRLRSIWDTADCMLSEAGSAMISAEDLISAWTSEPIGMKAGLGPVYFVAYALSRKDRVAVYGEGLFQSSFDVLCVEYLARNPASVALRQVDMEGLTGEILVKLGDMLKVENQGEPLYVAREIIRQFDELVPWTVRTQNLSPKTLKVRDILKRANDPNKLLFDDLPSISKPNRNGEFDADKIAISARNALAELRAAYPNALAELKALMLTELDVRSESSDTLAELRSRADTIRQIGGDLRLDAFVGRVAQFHGTGEDMEGLASIAANKLPRDWNDSDCETARVELVELSQRFLRLETIARVKGRKGKRHALAVVVGRDSAPHPLFSEFQVSDADQQDIKALVDAVDASLSTADQERREIILAALVEVTSRYIADEQNEFVRSLA